MKTDTCIDPFCDHDAEFDGFCMAHLLRPSDQIAGRMLSTVSIDTPTGSCTMSNWAMRDWLKFYDLSEREFKSALRAGHLHWQRGANGIVAITLPKFKLTARVLMECAGIALLVWAIACIVLGSGAIR